MKIQSLLLDIYQVAKHMTCSKRLLFPSYVQFNVMGAIFAGLLRDGLLGHHRHARGSWDAAHAPQLRRWRQNKCSAARFEAPPEIKGMHCPELAEILLGAGGGACPCG
jgi:hypothetical protein